MRFLRKIKQLTLGTDLSKDKKMNFPISLWEFSLLFIYLSAVLLIATELLSYHYGKTIILIDKKRLRLATMITWLLAIAMLTIEIYERLSSIA